MDVYQAGIVVLLGLAVSDLIVGVSNDAVNFLNSSVGSRVAPRHVIMIIASLGILAGVTFSSGMMEVARKGIFHPQYFTMPELMVLFLAVMLTDVILLDLYNTFGLPTSTTVSIVFELLGAAVAVSLIKINRAGGSFGELINYINTAKALAIISGILLSVVIAFGVGALVQYLSRMLFTFDFDKRLRRYGAVWGGLALALILYFILIKGAKGASFISADTAAWMTNHTWLILGAAFIVSAATLHLLILLTRVHVLQVIVLVGTFALAMAFAANDLVNFIGVPLAGISAYSVAGASGDLMTGSMEALQKPVQSNTWFLLAAGAVMVVTLWISRKARTVTRTEVRLGRQEEGWERFEATGLSQAIVRVVASLFGAAKVAIPEKLRRRVAKRFDRSRHRPPPAPDGSVPSFDLVRASVNLMVSSTLISFATSLKLPLSTTYVTFMVAMGTSLSDQAWGRESAVYRVTGVLTVIGGWFFTALMAFTVSFVLAAAVYYGRAPAVVVILILAALLIRRNHRLHRTREREEEALQVFNLRKIKDSQGAIAVTFEHTGLFLREVRQALSNSFEGLFLEDRHRLKEAKKQQRRIQTSANIIIANIFKVLRLLQREAVENTQRYTETIGALQEIAESQRDIVMRAHVHVANNHSGLLEAQIEELNQVKNCMTGLLDKTAGALRQKAPPDIEFVEFKNNQIKMLLNEFNQNQIMRIQDNSSKTRLSILFYGLMLDSLKIAEQTLHLLKIFQHPLHRSKKRESPVQPAVAKDVK